MLLGVAAQHEKGTLGEVSHGRISLVKESVFQGGGLEKEKVTAKKGKLRAFW